MNINTSICVYIPICVCVKSVALLLNFYPLVSSCLLQFSCFFFVRLGCRVMKLSGCNFVSEEAKTHTLMFFFSPHIIQILRIKWDIHTFWFHFSISDIWPDRPKYTFYSRWVNLADEAHGAELNVVRLICEW